MHKVLLTCVAAVMAATSAPAAASPIVYNLVDNVSLSSDSGVTFNHVSFAYNEHVDDAGMPTSRSLLAYSDGNTTMASDNQIAALPIPADSEFAAHSLNDAIVRTLFAAVYQAGLFTGLPTGQSINYCFDGMCNYGLFNESTTPGEYQGLDTSAYAELVAIPEPGWTLSVATLAAFIAWHRRRRALPT